MSIKAKKGYAQPIAGLLSTSSHGVRRDSTLAPLLGKAQAIERAQRQLDGHLPSELLGHVLVGGYTDGQLTLLTDRAVWLTWLRFERARLLALLRYLPEFAQIEGLVFKVRPLRPIKTAPRQLRTLSADAAERLNECANEVDDPRLKAALARLASHASSEPEQPG
ncbi:DUF721 domain-containing protein [Halotalea alkalilenta]|uniref:DUF721 domain-containing protein n=1 Tax=Halotalea alkalilenta TaxID=376489 RepID=UPI00047F69EF|nr:DciA family protein [Halotalea alkalilenta]